MRVMSAPRIVQDADKVIRMIVNTYMGPTKTLPELQATRNAR